MVLVLNNSGGFVILNLSDRICCPARQKIYKSTSFLNFLLNSIPYLKGRRIRKKPPAVLFFDMEEGKLWISTANTKAN